ncbi:BrnA antitoxin family protein [Treponema parvum]|uniref:BrnA antitoxin family protein n=1 Tax=Treponema parvum TaxID=138851 RepID=A0A975IF01_9SPIR|nr:BrnA antitoxin family protein [Treponema parvum]QTQ11218.1 BrnA antitoxin family protein [Treponema parvum]QTQ14610.1 BrnA antitoxin family protein [Treponema parvum]
MSTTVTMTLDDVRKLPPISEERKKEMDSFVNTDFSDCPKMTKEELSQFKPWYEVHPEWVRIKKGDIHTKIDLDLLDALKKGGKGYQKRLNQALRWALENNCPYMTV